MSTPNDVPFRTRKRLGKYRILRKLGEGGFAVVYEALDTIEGVRVALKAPRERHVTEAMLDSFRFEVRLSAQLEHPHILPLKNADFIDGHFVVAYPLGVQTLGDRMQSRMTFRKALDFAEQMLEGVAYAHECGVIHCDIKPENLIIFPGNHLQLTDFGISKVALNTVDASGSGTVGYIAPEQAMGKPSFRSDVFSEGVIMYRLFSGQLPEWPFDWPPPGIERLRKQVHPALIAIIRRSIELDPRKRFRDGAQLLAAFQRVKPRVLRFGKRDPIKKRKPSTAKGAGDWKALQHKQFQRNFGKELDTSHTCDQCSGPVSAAMRYCPWCHAQRKKHQGETRYPQKCPRCARGMKLDWRFCPWCYGAGFEVNTKRQYSDKRYTAKCANSECTRKSLMPFMRYCPWCRRKVKKKWTIAHSKKTCPSCSWGVVDGYWTCCPWCGKGLKQSAPKRS